MFTPNHSSLPADAAPGELKARPRKSTRARAWHASYAVLAVLTTQLLLTGCENRTQTEQGSVPGPDNVQTAPDAAPAPSAGYPGGAGTATPGATQPGMTDPGTTGSGMDGTSSGTGASGQTLDPAAPTGSAPGTTPPQP